MKEIYEHIFNSNLPLLKQYYPDIIQWFNKAMNDSKFEFILNKEGNCLLIYNKYKNKISNISILPSQNKQKTITNLLNNFFTTHNNTTISVDYRNHKMLLFLKRYGFVEYKVTYFIKEEVYLIYRR